MHRPKASAGVLGNGARGFTLLEILVVLTIVSLTSAIVFPRLGTMAASFQFASERDRFEQTLNGLPYQAFRDNRVKILLGTYTDEGRDERKKPRRDTGTTIAAHLRTQALLPEAREHLPPLNAQPADIRLPSGWEVAVAEPIYYSGAGYCSGGTVNLFVGNLQYTYVLNPPLCRAQLVD